MFITYTDAEKTSVLNSGTRAPKLPLGDHDLIIAITNIETAQKDNGPVKLFFTGEVIKDNKGVITTGTEFGDYINIQSTNPDPRKKAIAESMAKDLIGKFIKGVFGEEYFKSMQGFDVLDGSIYNKPFNAIIKCKRRQEEDGTPGEYINMNFGKVEQISNQQANNAQPTQQAYNNTSVQQTNAQPSWGAPR